MLADGREVLVVGKHHLRSHRQVAERSATATEGPNHADAQGKREELRQHDITRRVATHPRQ